MQRLFKRKGLYDEDARDGEAPSALDELRRKSVEGQRSLPIRFADLAKPRPQKRMSAFIEGFSCHAGLHLRGNDREGLERLLLYGGRGPVANERLELLPDGRVSYRMKRPAANATTHLVSSPVDFLRRLAAITPPPRVNLLRFHGVFAPNAHLRPRVVPSAASPETTDERLLAPTQQDFDFRPAADGESPRPNSPPRLGYSWAELMKRTFRTDVLDCPRCHGRMRLVAFVTGPKCAASILERLGLASPAPPRAAAASPPRAALPSPPRRHSPRITQQARPEQRVAERRHRVGWFCPAFGNSAPLGLPQAPPARLSPRVAPPGCSRPPPKWRLCRLEAEGGPASST